MTDKFILDENRNAVPADLETWATWFETANRRVAEDFVGPYRVSTVFLGIDHSFVPGGPPLLFETMVFRGDSGMDEDMARCSMWAEAEAQHAKIVEKYRARGNA